MTTFATVACIVVAIVAFLCIWGLKAMIQEYHKDDEEWNRDLDRIIKEGFDDLKKHKDADNIRP